MIKATTSAMVMVQPTAKTIINIVFSLEDDIKGEGEGEWKKEERGRGGGKEERGAREKEETRC